MRHQVVLLDLMTLIVMTLLALSGEERADDAPSIRASTVAIAEVLIEASGRAIQSAVVRPSLYPSFQDKQIDLSKPRDRDRQLTNDGNGNSESVTTIYTWSIRGQKLMVRSIGTNQFAKSATEIETVLVRPARVKLSLITTEGRVYEETKDLPAGSHLIRFERTLTRGRVEGRMLVEIER